MDFVESFHGQEITVTTVRAADGRWTAAARFAAAPGQQVQVHPGPPPTNTVVTFATEEQARAAALEAAAAAIDRGRTATGKP